MNMISVSLIVPEQNYLQFYCLLLIGRYQLAQKDVSFGAAECPSEAKQYWRWPRPKLISIACFR